MVSPFSLHQLGEVRLKELYFEENPLIPPIPVPAEQQEEVLPLREMAARVVVKEIENWLANYPLHT